jgi:hypothetical protein
MQATSASPTCTATSAFLIGGRSFKLHLSSHLPFSSTCWCSFSSHFGWSNVFPALDVDSFVYQGLDKCTNEIRLASLVPVDGEMIQLKLETHRLSNAPMFVALSNEWGSSENSKDIFVNDRLFSIRQNLNQGLIALWDYQQVSGSSVTFWADALCIDQSNVTERGHQVNLMGNI